MQQGRMVLQWLNKVVNIIYMLALHRLGQKKEAGFTLIELLVAVAILGILSTIALGSFQSSQMRSRDAKRKSDLKQIANALEMFYSDKGRYPASSNGQIVACPYSTGTCFWGSGEFKDSSTGVIYFKTLPADPSGFSYYYVASASGSAFQLYAHLENPKDQNCVNSNCSVAARSGINCGGDVCNFAITSANVTPTDTTLP